MVDPARLTHDAELLKRFLARLDAELREAVDTVCAACEAAATPLYLVGGAVRDLLSGRPHLDVNLAVEGPLAAAMETLARRCAPALTLHQSFGTATAAGSGWSMDLARTRAERYAYPGALPEVSPATIDADLGRRDFTVHAMALGLTGLRRGALLDPHGGGADLERRLLRVIHDGSFRDDPTRILRLARYSARLGFDVEEHTLELGRKSATYLDAVSGVRISHELERIFLEPRPEECLVALRDLRSLRRIYHELDAPATLSEVFGRLRADGGPRPAMAEYLAALAAGWDRGAVQRLVDRLGLDRNVAAVLREVPDAARALRALVREDDPAQVVRLGDPFRAEALRGAAAAAGGLAYERVRWYLQELRGVAPLLRGGDLLALGLPAGPAVGEALSALRAARLRGQVRSREDEVALVKKRLAEGSTRAGGGS